MVVRGLPSFRDTSLRTPSKVLGPLRGTWELCPGRVDIILPITHSIHLRLEQPHVGPTEQLVRRVLWGVGRIPERLRGQIKCVLFQTSWEDDIGPGSPKLPNVDHKLLQESDNFGFDFRPDTTHPVQLWVSLFPLYLTFQSVKNHEPMDFQGSWAMALLPSTVPLLN